MTPISITLLGVICNILELRQYIMFPHSHQYRYVISPSNAVGVIKRFSFIFYLYDEMNTILEDYCQASELPLLLESNCKKSLETTTTG